MVGDDSSNAMFYKLQFMEPFYGVHMVKIIFKIVDTMCLLHGLYICINDAKVIVGKGTNIFLSQIKVVANVLYWSVALLYKLVVKEKNNATSN